MLLETKLMILINRLKKKSQQQPKNAKSFKEIILGIGVTY